MTVVRFKRVLFILFFTINTVISDSKVLERYERQLNRLSKKMNNGKPVIVNGKMKRYKCVEEYVLLDEYGNVIADSTEALDGDGQSNKDHYIEPKYKKSSLDVLPPSISHQPPFIPHPMSTVRPKTRNDEGRMGIFNAHNPTVATTTTTTTTTTERPTTTEETIPSMNEIRTKMPEQSILRGDGLNIRRLPPKPKIASDSIKNIKTVKIDKELVPFERSPDSSMYKKYRQQSLRSSQSKYPYEVLPSIQKDYDDYQYYEMNQEFVRRPNYRYRTNYYRNYGPDYEFMHPGRSRGQSRQRLSPIKYDNNNIRMPLAYSRDNAPSTTRRRYSTNARRGLLPINGDNEYYPKPMESLKPLNTELNRSKYPTRQIPVPPGLHRPGLQPLPIDPVIETTQSPIPLPLSNPAGLSPLPPAPATASQPASPPSPDLQMNSENCNKVKQFAKTFNVSDPEKWVRENCLFALSFAPGYTCEDIAKFVSSCKRHHFF